MDEDEAHKKERIVAHEEDKTKDGSAPLRAINSTEAPWGGVVTTIEDGRSLLSSATIIRALTAVDLRTEIVVATAIQADPPRFGSQQGGESAKPAPEAGLKKAAGMQTSVSAAIQADPPRIGSHDLKRFVLRLAPSGLRDRLLATLPTEYVPLQGGRLAKGWSVEWFDDLLQAYIEAMAAGTLEPSQRHLAVRAVTLTKIFRRLGIIAYFHDLAGYVPSRGTYTRAFDQLFRLQAEQWRVLFTPEVIGAIARAHGDRWSGGRPPQWFRQVVCWLYEVTLGSEAHDELKRRNALYKSHHHSFFQDPLRLQMNRDLAVIQTIAEQAYDWNDFTQRVNARFLGTAFQPWLMPARNAAATLS